MKDKVIVITDFSEESKNSVLYSIRLCDQLKKDLLVIYIVEIYNYVAGTTDTDILSNVLPMDNIKEMELSASEILSKMIVDLSHVTNPNVNIETKTITGHLVTDTLAETLICNCCLLILPMPKKGKKNTRFTPKVVSGIINESLVPVLTVQGPELKPLNKLLYATDFKRTDLYAIKNLVDLLIPFEPEIYILHVCDKKTDFRSELMFEGFQKRLKHEMPYEKYKFRMIHEKKLEKAILKEVNDNGIECVVMLKDNETLFGSLFEASHTEKVALSLDVPLIVYHNQLQE